MFANTNKETITYCPAKDTPSPEALRERPDLPAQKMSWLQRHDRESGDLYGIVTLVKGMPVALTDHIDRSPDKQLLRGKVGEVHSWILHEQETSSFQEGVRVLRKLPQVVFVKFRNADGSDVDWKLPGLPEKGLYPIVCKKGTWFLDRGRANPRLRITRSQLPLAPAFALTSHAAQGQTLTGGAIVDLCTGAGSNPLGSYVAMTRVTRREYLLIYRPFSRDVLTKGEREGPNLLLQHLRGEQIDWPAIEAKYMPRKQCSECNFIYFKDDYQPMQWSRKDHLSVCKACMSSKKQQGTPFRCNTCGLWKGEDAFTFEQQHGMCLLRRVCEDCLEMRKRTACTVYKSEKDFTPCQWRDTLRSPPIGKCKACMWSKSETKKCAGPCSRTLPSASFTARMWRESADLRKCLSCMPKCPRGHWRCVECKDVKPLTEYSDWLLPRARKVNNGTARCNGCQAAQQTFLHEVTNQSLVHVHKSKQC